MNCDCFFKRVGESTAEPLCPWHPSNPSMTTRYERCGEGDKDWNASAIRVCPLTLYRVLDLLPWYGWRVGVVRVYSLEVGMRLLRTGMGLDRNYYFLRKRKSCPSQKSSLDCTETLWWPEQSLLADPSRFTKPQETKCWTFVMDPICRTTCGCRQFGGE